MEKLKGKLSRPKTSVEGQKNRNSNTSVTSPGGRTRRGGFGAFHFKSNKLCKELLAAAKAGDTKKVHDILVEDGIELHELDPTDQAIRLACEGGHVETVSTLITFGAKAGTLGENDRAPLHIAAKHGWENVANCLITNGVNIHVHSRFEKRTPAHIAAAKGHQSILKLITENSEGEHSLDQRDIYGDTPLHLAVRSGNVATAEFLVNNKEAVDVNAYNNDGWTSLHLACETGDENMVRLLLDNHAQVDSQNKYGRTALHWAATKNHSGVVRILLQSKADATIKDLHNKMAYEYAKDAHIAQILRMVSKDKIGIFEQPKPENSISDYLKIDRRESFMQTVGEGTVLPGVLEFVKAMAKAVECSKPMTKANTESPTAIRPIASTVIKPNFETIAEVSECDSGSRRPSASDDDLSVILKQCAAEDKPSTPASSRAVTRKPSSADDSENSSVVESLPFEASVSSGTHEKSSENSISNLAHPTFEVVGEAYKRNDQSPEDKEQNPSAEAEGGRNLFNKLVAMVSEHCDGVEWVVNTLSTEIAQAATGRQTLSSQKVMNISNRLHKLQDSLFDFREEFEQKCKLMDRTMEGFMLTFQNRLNGTDSLGMEFHYAFFTAVAHVVASQTDGPMKLTLRLGSEEEKDNALHAARKDTSSNQEKALRILWFVLVQLRHEGAVSFQTVLNYISRCNMESNTSRQILDKFISLVCPHVEDSLNSRTLYNLSMWLGKDGEKLWPHLNLSSRDLARETTMSEQDINLTMLSRWRHEGSRKKDCICDLVMGLIFAGREDLLTWVLSENNNHPEVKFTLYETMHKESSA